MLDRQKIFEDVVIALWKQGEKSVDHPESCFCMYRKTKSDGTILKCGIGHIIPDENYDIEIDRENQHAGQPNVYKRIDSKYGEVDNTVAAPGYIDDKAFLNLVQNSLHDSFSSNNKQDFRKALEAAANIFASNHNLCVHFLVDIIPFSD